MKHIACYKFDRIRKSNSVKFTYYQYFFYFCFTQSLLLSEFIFNWRLTSQSVFFFFSLSTFSLLAAVFR